ncbi:putative Protein of unknown function (DUF773) [Blattamonas nauphoetae]|uniref:Uncharacterized protein n=1 Tax=Blattamonas nauphoetae TaxID=2049346 RepID=A0ABQ9YM16_9EUKA|nr:putative Protein of unknown function (DUF773) [Blattamonas nauphoetae]
MSLQFTIPLEQASQKPQLDLAYDRVFSYLVDKGRITTQFNRDSKTVTSKLVNLFSDLDEATQDAFASEKDCLTYFSSETIFQTLLKRPGAAKKTMLGKYTDPVIQSWSQLNKQFPKNNTHIGHAVQVMTRIVQIDLPAIRKALQKCRADGDSLKHKKDEQTRSAQTFLREYEDARKAIGAIDGVDLHTALDLQTPQIPIILAKTILTRLSQNRPFQDALQLYVRFVVSTINDNKNKQSQIGPKTVLQSIQTLLKIPVSTLTAIEQRKPPQIQKPKSSKSSGIHDITEIVDTTGVIEVIDDEDNHPSKLEGENHIMRLINPRDRSALIRDLIELNGFLDQRLFEMESIEGSHQKRLQSTATGASGLDSTDLFVPINRLTEMKNAVEWAIDGFKDSKLEQLMLIKNSQSYVSRMIQQIETLKENAERMEILADKTQQLVDGSRSNLREQERSLKSSIDKVKQLSKQIETAINALPNQDKHVRITSLPTD